jgi:hypothetical protein
MNVFAAGTDVTLVVPLTDASGNALAVDAITYSIFDQFGTQVQAPIVMEDYSPGSETVDIAVPASLNLLEPGVPRALRQIELGCTIGANVVNLHANYVITIPDPLVVGLNSFGSYASIQFASLDVPNLLGWEAAGQFERMAALIDARERITRLSFTPFATNPGMDHLAFVPEGTRETRYPGAEYVGDLSNLTPAQFAKLPQRFIAALIKAQIVEADSLLGGNTIEARRQEGLVQDDVGESRQVYRGGRPLQLPVCRRALAYLSLYVNFSKRIGRC